MREQVCYCIGEEVARARIQMHFASIQRRVDLLLRMHADKLAHTFAMAHCASSQLFRTCVRVRASMRRYDDDVCSGECVRLLSACNSGKRQSHRRQQVARGRHTSIAPLPFSKALHCRCAVGGLMWPPAPQRHYTCARCGRNVGGERASVFGAGNGLSIVVRYCDKRLRLPQHSVARRRTNERALAKLCAVCQASCLSRAHSYQQRSLRFSFDRLSARTCAHFRRSALNRP